MGFTSQFMDAIQEQLPTLGNKSNAFGAQAYMKDISIFLGVKTPERRSTVKQIAKELPMPTAGSGGDGHLEYLVCVSFFIPSITNNKN